MVYILVYVDDILIACCADSGGCHAIESRKASHPDSMLTTFETYLPGHGHRAGWAKNILQMSQKSLTAQLVDKHGLGDCKLRAKLSPEGSTQAPIDLHS